MRVVQTVKLDLADRSAQASLVILMTDCSVFQQPIRSKPAAAKLCRATRSCLAVIAFGTRQNTTKSAGRDNALPHRINT